MSAYIKRKSDGKILHSGSKQTVNNPAHLASFQDFVVSRGLSLTDYEIGDAAWGDIESMINSAKTTTELWKISMQATDSSCPRWFEDYVTENSVALAPGKSKESYDAKVALRGQKPK